MSDDNPVKWVREQLGMSQEQFANTLDTVQTAVSRWESLGAFRCRPAQLDKIRELCKKEIKGWQDNWLFSPPD